MVYHWTLGLVVREQNTKLITLITNLKSWIQSLPQTGAEAAQVISKLWCDILHHYHYYARYVGLAGSGLGEGSKPTPPDKNFQSQVWGSSSTSGGLNPPPTPPTNRTLTLTLNSQSTKLQSERNWINLIYIYNLTAFQWPKIPCQCRLYRHLLFYTMVLYMS